MRKVLNIEHKTLNNCEKKDWDNILEGKYNDTNFTPTISLKNENDHKIKTLCNIVNGMFRKENDDFKFQSIPVFDTHPEEEKSDYNTIYICCNSSFYYLGG